MRGYPNAYTILSICPYPTALPVVVPLPSPVIFYEFIDTDPVVVYILFKGVVLAYARETAYPLVDISVEMVGVARLVIC